MSLVVLRSWSDGQPPKIRGIAPPDSDDKNERVVPDHQGRFVTEEIPIMRNNANSKVGAMKERFLKSSNSSVDTTNNQRVAKFWNRKSLPSSSNSLSSNSLTPSPTPEKIMGIESGENKLRDNRSAKMSLSRESSLQSLQSMDQDSSPSSPVGGVNSRYKSLGPELAATIPKRQIIRDSWVRDSYSIFRKKELSKSTPTLNLVSPEEEDQDHLEELESDRVRNNILSVLGDPTPKSRSISSDHIATDPSRSNKSWQDSLYGGEFEPKFGDKPASVVGVIKKESSPNSTAVSIERRKSSPNPNSKTSPENPTPNSPTPPRPNSFYSTTINSPTSPLSSNKSFNNNFSIIGDKESEPTSADLRRVKREAKKAIRSVSFELDLHFAREGGFPVHRAVHQNNPTLNNSDSDDLVVLKSEIKDDNEKSPLVPDTPPADEEDVVDIVEVEDNECIDLELDALRGESSSCASSGSGGESERENFQSESQNQGVNNKIDNDMHLNFRKNSRVAASATAAGADTNLNSHGGHGNKHGSAWAQVPVQCVNRHVIVPVKPPTIPSPVKPIPDYDVLTNGDGADVVDFVKNNLRRKNFCDELLNDVVLQVPPLPQPPPPITTLNMNQRPASPTNNTSQENHDGIIIFDEEDEFEEMSETDSIALSERENSFEYLSVFQNVKVGSPTECKPRPSEPAHIIGLDLGSTFSRHCSLDKSKGTVEIGDAFRTLVTSDGLTQGVKAIYHSMATKSKLIYKWRSRQTFPYDPYDDEDNSSILEVLFKHYSQVLEKKIGPRPGQGSLRPDSPDANNHPVQWNVSVHSGMERKVVRESAFSSGLVKSMDELRLVNESTAAAVMAYKFLKEKNNQQTSQRRGVEKTFLSINIGSTYVHTSGYQFSGDGKMHMIENGDSQTFQSPESQFIELLARVFSPEFLLKYESRFTPAWVDILIRFEAMKDNYVKFDSECYLFLPISFFLEFFKCTGIQVPECIEDNPGEGIVWDNNGAIRFTKDLMDDWLEPTLNLAKARIKVKSYDFVVLSGGGANETLRKQLEKHVPSNVQVFFLDNPQNTVVQGLVSLGSVNLCLKSPFSIGVGVMTPFDESIHPQEKCVTRSGKKWCSDVWDNLIRKGQPMTVGDVVLKRTYVGAQPGQNVLVLPIFKSDQDEPKLVTSPSVEKCCELRFEINKEKSWREVQLVIKCCDRELQILATGNDGDVSHVVIDF